MSEEDKIRGEIYNEEAFKQPMLFSGMKYERNITPSDWDLFIDFGGKLFFYGEGKKKPNELTDGQKYSIQHVCDSHEKAGNKSIGFMYWHEIEVPYPVYVKDQTVIKWYYNKKWRLIPEDKRPNVLNFIDAIRKWLKL